MTTDPNARTAAAMNTETIAAQQAEIRRLESDLARTRVALRAVLKQIADEEDDAEEHLIADYSCPDCTVNPTKAKPLCARHKAERLLKEAK